MQRKQKTEPRARGIQQALFVSLLLCALFFVVVPVVAQTDVTGLEPLTATGLVTTDIRVVIANIIRVFLGLLGVIALILVLYGGFVWMTAAGNEEKIATAKKLLMNAAIGLAIILSAYSITVFIMSRFLDAGAGGGSVVDDGGGATGGGRRGALGGGIVENHYPERSATNIARNTKIIVTFKEPMQVATLITGDTNNTENVLLRKTIANPPTARDFITLKTSAMPDGKTFVFTPEAILGSPSEPISYTMRFEKGLKKANGQDAFGQFGTFYEWQFEVSTVIDIEAPKVVSVLPVADSTQPRNVVVQVVMSEPIDPTMVVGNTTTSKVRVTDATARLDGVVSLANQYKTIEFVTSNLCGKNSCGGDVFCLPASATITVRLVSAALTEEKNDGDFTATIPYTGIVDLAGNALNGNGNTVADGPGNATTPNDDYVWTFGTNDTIDLVPPRIETLDPTHQSGRVALDKPIRAGFSKPLMASTFNAATVKLEALVNNTPTVSINYWTGTEERQGKTVGIIYHDAFVKNTAYTPTITAGVKDVFQNCYFPCGGIGCMGTQWQGYPSCKLP